MTVRSEDMPRWEALNRALQALQSLPNLDTEAQLAGINAILEKMDALKNLGGGRPPNSFPIDSEAFGAAYACYVTGDALVRDAAQHVMDTHYVSRRQAEAILKKLKPRVLEYGRFIERLQKLSTPK